MMAYFALVAIGIGITLTVMSRPTRREPQTPVSLLQEQRRRRHFEDV